MWLIVDFVWDNGLFLLGCCLVGVRFVVCLGVISYYLGLFVGWLACWNLQVGVG